MPPQDDITILVSLRVADAQHGAPHSTQQPCSRCQAAVWVSPASAELLARGSLVCTHCLTNSEQLQMAIEGARVTPAQQREVAAYLVGRN